MNRFLSAITLPGRSSLFTRRSFSTGCRYPYASPAFTPFWACVTVGSFYTYLLMVRSRNQYHTLYLELNEIKKAQKAQRGQGEKGEKGERR